MSQSVITNAGITIVIPAYNEHNSIEKTINGVAAYFQAHENSYEIIVYADGNDGTREIVAKMSETNPRIIIMGNIERRGKGYGIRQAVLAAHGQIIGFIDADNKTPFTEFEKFMPYFRQGYEVVIGSRGHRESIIEQSQPLYRRLGSKVFAIYMHLVVGLWDIMDTQCGFKFFRAEIAHNLFSRQKIDGYMFDVEIIYLARCFNYKIYQIPIRWRDDGDSRLNLLGGNIQNFIDILRIRFFSG
jgi:dolichyl-phosphate beta-glucosyltransferase